MEQGIKRNHGMSLENRKKLTVSGAEDVVSSNEMQLIIRTSLGMLAITGKNLQIRKLNIEDGTVAIDGDSIDMLRYTEAAEKGGMLKRMFK